MSGTLTPDPIGRSGRRRLYSRALSPAMQRQGGPAAMDVPTFSGAMPGMPTPPIDPATRSAMMAQTLRQAPRPAPSTFQAISSLGGTAPPSADLGDATVPSASPAEAPGIGVATAPGAEDRISTRVPKDVQAEARDAPHTRNDLEIGTEAARQHPASWKKKADLIRSYMHLDTKGLSDDEVHEKFINHLTDNLVWLHDKIDPATRAESKRWYDGANAIAHRWAEEYNLQPRQAAAVLAALSPQKDWFQNVDLAQRILKINRDSQNYITDDKMRDRLRAYVAATKNKDAKSDMQGSVDAIGNKSLSEITDPLQRALWIRAHDEVHNDRSYKVVTPEGDFGQTAVTAKGKPQKVAWGSFKEIHKAMQALQDGSLENISRNMGGNHKVRNFYNNIIAPMFGRDATIDTHAIGAANLLPVGSKSPLVAAGLGLKGGATAQTGVRGLYPHYIEAHRRAAERISNRPGGELTLPRELQSITWEGIRGTYTPEQKRDKKFVAAINDIWHSYARGEIDADTARERSVKLGAPGGIRAPKHLRSGAADDA